MAQRSRAWVFTHNNYETTALQDQLECRYIIYGKEVAPLTGTPHLQGYVYFANARTPASVRRLLPGCHISIARGSYESNFDYCSKGGDYTQRGDPPVPPGEQGAREVERYDFAWLAAKEGRLEDIDAGCCINLDIRVRLYTTLRRIERDYMPAVVPLESVCGLWIWGESGCGKTRSVMGRFPDAYVKPRNVWWDGYQGESIVLCDDVDIFDVKLGGLFKHWADYLPFIAEIKGSSRKIRPERFIVTSQYKFEDIWSDQETRAALTRRFVVVNKIINQEIIIYPFAYLLHPSKTVKEKIRG